MIPDRRPALPVSLASALAAFALPAAGRAQDPESFAAACAAAAEAATTRTVAGADPEWLFLKSELAHLGKGKFWRKDWAEVSEAGEDPVPIFLALNEKLAALGVEFIFVPVPAKAAIYPEKFIDGAAPDDPASNAEFLKRLSDGGITVIDLEAKLRAAKGGGPAPSYCKTDSHPSPATCQLIASLVAERLRDEGWAKAAAAASGTKFSVADPVEVKVKGDLIPDGERDSWPPEALSVAKVDGAGGPATPDHEASPVILLGDSHTLIFHEGGEMLMTGAGVPDHLQAELGFRVYLAASRGSSSQAQRQIYRDADFWEGKKALVWVSSAREFTQERKWLKLPRLPK